MSSLSQFCGNQREVTPQHRHVVPTHHFKSVQVVHAEPLRLSDITSPSKGEYTL
jgi:hypothetical protein